MENKRVYNISEYAKQNTKKNGWGGARPNSGSKPGVSKVTAKDLKDNLETVKKMHCRYWLQRFLADVGFEHRAAWRKTYLAKRQQILRAGAAQILNECLLSVYLNGSTKEKLDFIKHHGDRYMNTMVDIDEDGNRVKEDPLQGLADALQRIKKDDDDKEN